MIEECLTDIKPAQIWVYMPHGRSGPELTYDKQHILDDMANDLAAAQEDDPEGNSWLISDTHIYVDDGYGEAWLVDLP